MADVTPEAAEWRRQRDAWRYGVTPVALAAAGDALADALDRATARNQELTDALRDAVARDQGVAKLTSKQIIAIADLLRGEDRLRRVLGDPE